MQIVTFMQMSLLPLQCNETCAEMCIKEVRVRRTRLEAHWGSRRHMLAWKTLTLTKCGYFDRSGWDYIKNLFGLLFGDVCSDFSTGRDVRFLGIFLWRFLTGKLFQKLWENWLSLIIKFNQV